MLSTLQQPFIMIHTSGFRHFLLSLFSFSTLQQPFIMIHTSGFHHFLLSPFSIHPHKLGEGTRQNDSQETGIVGACACGRENSVAPMNCAPPFLTDQAPIESAIRPFSEEALQVLVSHFTLQFGARVVRVRIYFIDSAYQNPASERWLPSWCTSL